MHRELREAAAKNRRQHQQQIEEKQPDNSSLFEAPEKMDPEMTDFRVKEVFGEFRPLKELLEISNSFRCIPLDYQPTYYGSPSTQNGVWNKYSIEE